MEADRGLNPKTFANSSQWGTINDDTREYATSLMATVNCNYTAQSQATTERGMILQMALRVCLQITLDACQMHFGF